MYSEVLFYVPHVPWHDELFHYFSNTHHLINSGFVYDRNVLLFCCLNLFTGSIDICNETANKNKNKKGRERSQKQREIEY